MTTIADEVVGRVPVLNHLEPIVHLVLSFAGGQIIAEEDGLLGLADLSKSLVGRMRHIVRDNELGKRFFQIIYEAGNRPIQSTIALGLRDQVARLEVPALRKALNEYRSLTGSIIESLETRSSANLRVGIENYLRIARQFCLSLHRGAEPQKDKFGQESLDDRSKRNS